MTGCEVGADETAEDYTLTIRLENQPSAPVDGSDSQPTAVIPLVMWLFVRCIISSAATNGCLYKNGQKGKGIIRGNAPAVQLQHHTNAAFADVSTSQLLIVPAIAASSVWRGDFTAVGSFSKCLP
ncbi:hypothetical protein ROHU_005782 [Labeo rohita]|uniref:Uncharacterized protein n=1 Tax=Labeo rohita TaxID=84645 RepID=A0A498N1G2_LABRO|nr:hypothetical protein ROHU_005782 [Labeo rohita]